MAPRHPGGVGARPPLLGLGVLLALLGAPGAAAPPWRPRPQVRWEYVVTVKDLRRGLAEIDWTLHGLSGEVQVCAHMDGAEREVRALWQLDPGGPRRVERPGPEAECWVLAAPAGRPLRLRYEYDLAALARRSGDPDYASRVGDDYIFSDQSVLLRPDPLPAGAPIEVELRLPSGVSAATPWQPAGAAADGAPRFRYDSDHYEGGSYVAIGRLRPLGRIEVGGGAAGVHVLARARRAPDATLLRWVEEALSATAQFYGELPGRRVHVILAPVPDSDEPDLFGAVMRRGPPSVVLFFGADAPPERFARSWMAVHEVFHTGNPRVRGRFAWFIEGFTTYYQDVLRARSGAETPLAMWGDLHDGFRRHCDPVGGVSLKQESERLRQSHRYTRVYWGGACVAFLVDVAIRERSGGRRGLDHVLRDLRRKTAERPMFEDEIVAALEREAGPGLVRRLLRSRAPLPLRDTYRRLGIEPTGPDQVRVHDDAPLAAVRRAILGG